jgi:hypothetical protein
MLMRVGLIGKSLFAAFLAAFVWACGSNDVTFGGPLDLQISTNSPVAVTDSLQLDYDVVGRVLVGMVIQWGDTELDSLYFSGAQTAAGRVRHQYVAPGAYTVRALVVDQLEGEQAKELSVTIQP